LGSLKPKVAQFSVRLALARLLFTTMAALKVSGCSGRKVKVQIVSDTC